MAASPLVTTAWLEDHLADPNLRIIEVCSLADDKAYREGHIPGAAWVYWKSACWHETDRQFISPQAMARCSAAWASGRIPPSCFTAIRFNSAPMRSGLSPWPGIATFACSTARAANGWRKAGRSRARFRAFLRWPIPRPPELVDARRPRQCARQSQEARTAAARCAFAGRI